MRIERAVYKLAITLVGRSRLTRSCFNVEKFLEEFTLDVELRFQTKKKSGNL